MATLTHVVMPVLFPACAKYYQVGNYFIDGANRQKLMEVSPDGVIRYIYKLIYSLLVYVQRNQLLLVKYLLLFFRMCSALTHCRCRGRWPLLIQDYAIEFKCIYPTDRKAPVMYTCPKWYVLQILAEMVVLNCRKLLLCFYSTLSMVVIECDFDVKLWEKVWSYVLKHFDHDQPHIIRGIQEISADLSDDLQVYSTTMCYCIGEFPSVVGINGKVIDTTDHPLTTAIMRKMLDDVREACRKQNARIMCEITDGEFLKIINCTEAGFPLTLLQRLKWRYQFFEKFTKKQLLDIVIHRINPPYNYPWSNVKSTNAKFIVAQHLKRLEAKRTNSDNRSVRNRIECLTTHERLQLLKDTKIGRRLKNANKEISNTVQPAGLATEVDEESTPITVHSNTQVRGILMSDEISSSSTYEALSIQEDNSNDEDYEPSETDCSSDDEPHCEIVETDDYTCSIPETDPMRCLDSIDFDHHVCLVTILDKLQKSKYQVKWKTYDVSALVNDFFITEHSLWKLKHLEMDIIQKEIYNFFGKRIFNISSSKAAKVASLHRLFSSYVYSSVEDISTESNPLLCSEHTIRSLYALSKKAVLQIEYPKALLKTVVCEMTNDEDLEEWLDSSPVRTVIDIPEANIRHRLFCYPEYKEANNDLQCRSLDPSHILNNLRSQICRHGFTGVSTEAFHDVSNENNKIISKSTLIDQLDKQKVSISKDFFSEEVEEILKRLGHKSEAKFVHLVRNWYEACDERGIDPIQRLRNLEAMQYHLKSLFNYYNTYPPPSRYIHGMSVQTFEALLITISSRFTLYSISDIGHYNHRAISTLGIESFFSELTRMEFSGLGTPKSCDIPKLISHIIQLNQVRHDPDRGFEFTLTKDSVYPYYLMEDSEEHTHPYFDNWFDHERKRKAKKKWSRISDPFKPDRGVVGVRPDLYRIDESKILMERRSKCQIKFGETINKI